jgi:hypothetical protein
MEQWPQGVVQRVVAVLWLRALLRLEAPLGAERAAALQPEPASLAARRLAAAEEAADAAP